MDDFAKRVVTVLIFLLVVAACFFYLSGCNSMFKPKETIETIVQTGPQKMWSTVSRSNKLVPFAIPIIAIGAVVAFNGMAKMGMSCIIFGCVNLFMSLATSRFALWMSVFGLIGSAAAVAASILIKNRDVRELITGTQVIKDYGVKQTNLNKDGLNSLLKEEQSTLTQRIVQQVKLKLKLKGEM